MVVAPDQALLVHTQKKDRDAEFRPVCTAFASDAKLARAAGIAPIPVSSGRNDRHRLDRGGNRQINAAIHRIAATCARCDPHTQDYIAHKKTEGKTNRDAIRCLKRHLARRVWNLLRTPIPITSKALTQSTS